MSLQLKTNIGKLKLIRGLHTYLLYYARYRSSACRKSNTGSTCKKIIRAECSRSASSKYLSVSSVRRRRAL